MNAFDSSEQSIKSAPSVVLDEVDDYVSYQI